MRRSPLEKALAEVAKGRASYADALAHTHLVSTRADAEAVRAALTRYEPDGEAGAGRRSGLFHLAALFLRPRDEQARRHLRDLALGRLVDVYDEALERGAPDDELVFVLKILAAYESREGTLRVIDGLRRFPGAPLWSEVLRAYEDEHPEVDVLLASPLPDGFAAVAFLDLANVLAIEGRLDHHPFDTEAGCARLERFLESADPAEASYAHSAATALPFIEPARRAPLLARALSHPRAQVRLEAAWAAARAGDERGISMLTEACADRSTAERAADLLRELGRADAIPGA